MLKLLRCAMIIQYSITVELHRFDNRMSPYKRFAGMFYLAYVQIIQQKIHKVDQIERIERFLELSRIVLTVTFIKRLLSLRDNHVVTDMVIDPILVTIHDITKQMDVNLIRVSYSKIMSRSNLFEILNGYDFSTKEISALISYIQVMYDYLEICDDIIIVVDIITTINKLVKQANKELQYEEVTI